MTEPSGDLRSFFRDGKCPDCHQNTTWRERQDSGHDFCIECPNCGAKFGVQGIDTLQMIERLV
jgi:ribosomal protein S27E